MKWQVVGITNADYFYLKRPGYLVTCKCYCFSEKRSEDFTDFFFLSAISSIHYTLFRKKSPSRTIRNTTISGLACPLLMSHNDL